MVILKLTNRNGGAFYLNAMHIVFLSAEGSGTNMELTDDRECFCRESLTYVLNQLRR